MRTVTAKGPTVEQAIQNALNEMNTTKDNVTIRILEEPQDKISGDITSKYAKVEVTLNEGEIDIIKQFLNDIFKAMNLKVDIHAHYDEDILYIEMISKDTGVIIGRRGQTLDALQYLT